MLPENNHEFLLGTYELDTFNFHMELCNSYNTGRVYRLLGQSDKALDYYQQALPIREEVGD
jgi:hypothetical protein